MKIITINCKNVKCYLIKITDGYLLFDAGWPDQYTLFKDHVKSIGIDIKDIKKLIVSHFHIDHAGLAGLLSKNGVEFTVLENQINEIHEMEEFITRKNYSYYKIDKKMINILSLNKSRDWLKSINIDGEIIQTFSHGDGSIALALDGGEALIGDLPPDTGMDEKTTKDWQKLHSLNARYIYPAHAGYFEMIY